MVYIVIHSFYGKSYFVAWIYDMLLIHSSVDGHLVCFYPLAIMHNTAMNTYGQVSVQTYVFISLGYIHRGAELLGHVVTLCLTLDELPD